MNQSQLLAKKYGLPEFKVIWIPIDDFENSIHSECYSQKIPLDRDISALMTLALEHDIWYREDSGNIATYKNDNMTYSRALNWQKYADHQTQIDALCEALSQALLADEG